MCSSDLTCPPSVVYSGAAQTPCTASVTGAGGLDEALVVSYGPNTNVGTVNVSASYAGTSDYAAGTGSTSFAITQKQLSVNADPQTKVYGETDPDLTWSYSGFVDGESASNVTITGSASCSRAPGESVAEIGRAHV